MPEEKTIETSTISVKDNSGKLYKFTVKVRSGYSHLIERADLSFYVSYEKMPVLGMTVYKVLDKNEFQTDSTSGWTFELPEHLRNMGIGSRLWKELEGVFCKYRVTSVWGNLETISKTDAEITRKAEFWKRMGFNIVRKYEIHKVYVPRAI
ncbi:MAG: hypothetical protein NTX79_06525 [Candidatus Micrarchaeota archaeon]|nr:hypothetical protein [Candidatus Micrarchaeota archaeon]